MNKSFRIAVPLLEFFKPMERSWNAQKLSVSGTLLTPLRLNGLLQSFGTCSNGTERQIVPRSEPLSKLMAEHLPSCKAATLIAAALQSAWLAGGSERQRQNLARFAERIQSQKSAFSTVRCEP